MKKEKREIIGISMTAFIAVLLALLILPASASATTISIGSETAAPGKTVTVPLMIYNVTGAGSVSVNLTYNPSVVIAVNVTNSSFEIKPQDPPVYPERGYVVIDACQIFTGLSGDVKIADVKLKAVGPSGQSSLLNLKDVKLQDMDMKDIPIAAVINGTFSIPDEDKPVVTKPTAMPSLISNDGTTSSMLSVNVTDASDISNVTVDLRAIGKTIKRMDGPYPSSGIYYTSTNTSVGILPGIYNLTVNATDVWGNSNKSVNITLKVIERVPISIESVSAPANGSVISRIKVSGATALSPVYSCTVYVNYNKSVVIVRDVAKGDFDNITSTIYDPYGVTYVYATQTVSPGLTGDKVVAKLNFTAVGPTGSSSSLVINKTGPAPIAPPVLKNKEGEDIPYTAVNGEFIVRPMDIEPPVVTNPTATPALIPDDTDNNPTCSGTSYSEKSKLNVTVTDLSGVSTVTINLSQIGGSATQVMDLIGGGVYSVETNASAGTPPATYKLRVNATDIYGNSNTTVNISLTVMKNGDVYPYPSGDGKVDFMGDAVYLVRYTRGVPGYTSIHLNVADVYGGDCKVDFMGDAVYLVRYTRGVPGYTILY